MTAKAAIKRGRYGPNSELVDCILGVTFEIWEGRAAAARKTGWDWLVIGVGEGAKERERPTLPSGLPPLFATCVILKENSNTLLQLRRFVVRAQKNVNTLAKISGILRQAAIPKPMRCARPPT